MSKDETYNNFEKAVFDALQLAYKVTANSLYGQIGSRVSPIYLKDIRQRSVINDYINKGIL